MEVNCFGAVEDQAILYEMKDRAQVREFREHLQITPCRRKAPYRCTDYPATDWYTGDQRLAVTAITAWPSLRWRGFRGDVSLTPVPRRPRVMQQTGAPEAGFWSDMISGSLARPHAI